MQLGSGSLLPSCNNISFVIKKPHKEQEALQPFLEGNGTAVLPEASIFGDMDTKIPRLAIHYVKLGTVVFISKLLCFFTVAVVLQKTFSGDLQSYCSHHKYISK